MLAVGVGKDLGLGGSAALGGRARAHAVAGGGVLRRHARVGGVQRRRHVQVHFCGCNGSFTFRVKFLVNSRFQKRAAEAHFVLTLSEDVYGEFGGARGLEIDDSAGGSAEIRNQTNPLFDVGWDVLAGLENSNNVDVTVRMEHTCECIDALVFRWKIDGDYSLEWLSLLFFRRSTSAVSGGSVVTVTVHVVLSIFELLSVVFRVLVWCSVSRSGVMVRSWRVE